MDAADKAWFWNRGEHNVRRDEDEEILLKLVAL
jgi:hypothetical protein